jgi:hypothetical protein
MKVGSINIIITKNGILRQRSNCGSYSSFAGATFPA